jgi:hypothetical protein
MQNRDEFREAVFLRDKHTCVVPGCGKPAVDAHHLIERALWHHQSEEGRYFVDNGVSVCEKHHKHAELNYILPVTLRKWAGIKNRVIPRQLDSSKYYTKWGIELPEPTRDSIKYPHTPYLTFSPSADTKDVQDSGYFVFDNFKDKPLIVTIKMDGSNMMVTREKITARNGYDATHKSFDMAKALHARICDVIPDGVQIFGEWLYAKHSIFYSGDIALESLFMPFGVYTQADNMWGGWEDVEYWAKKIGFQTVPVLGRLEATELRILDNTLINMGEKVIKQGHEGIVVRSTYPFHYSQFTQNMAKYVRPNHVQTDVHWSQQPIIKNEVRVWDT